MRLRISLLQGKFCCHTKNEELFDNDQKDMVDSAVSEVYCLGGAETPETRMWAVCVELDMLARAPASPALCCSQSWID